MAGKGGLCRGGRMCPPPRALTGPAGQEAAGEGQESEERREQRRGSGPVAEGQAHPSAAAPAGHGRDGEAAAATPSLAAPAEAQMRHSLAERS